MAQIQGTMREAPLADVLQLVCGTGKTGCFHVVERAKRCRIFLNHGQIVHAVFKTKITEKTGVEALYTVCLWLDGTYHFEDGEGYKEERSITRANAMLLMDMGTKLAEWKVLSQKVGGVDWYPMARPDRLAVPFTSDLQEEVLFLATGHSTLGDIAGAMGRPVLDVAKDVYSLAVHGALKVYPKIPVKTAVGQN